jgi:threonine dehydrogenase-like Zn-dependent dehydrogenase
MVDNLTHAPAASTASGESAFGRPTSGPSHVIAVIGVGYVGLPTAATLAHLGHKVTCGDANPTKVEMLQRGEVPIVEEHLDAGENAASTATIRSCPLSGCVRARAQECAQVCA